MPWVKRGQKYIVIKKDINREVVMLKVSVVVPVYNSVTFIEKCLESVIQQTMTDNVECILVDDCGRDNSMQIAERFIVGYDGNIAFRILHQTHNQGPSAARNRGIREATGEYVFFLDSDDCISPDCIEQLYGFAKKFDADYVQGTYESFENLRLASIPYYSDDKREIKRLLLNHNKIPFAPHNRLIRRQMILDNNLFFDERIRVREDFLWMTFVAKYVNCFAYCDKVTYHRVVNEDSLTHNVNREREILGYRILIETMVANYDSFQLGSQKELALEALLMALRAGYYHSKEEREHLIDCVIKENSIFERVILRIFLKTNSSKVLHALIRLYKLED